MAHNSIIIETERLLLRGIDEGDTKIIVKWRSVPEIYRYFKFPHQITVDEHLSWYYNAYLENPDRFDWIGIEKESGNKIGVFGLHRENERSEINYLLAPASQHKGYAAEAIKALIDYASKKWNIKQVVAEIHKDNQPSLALVKKLGFELIYMNDTFVVYGIEV